MEQTEKTEACPICKREFKGKHAEGALRLHILKGHGAKVEANNPPAKPKKAKAEGSTWRWLDKAVQEEARAIKAGFLEIDSNGDLR